MRRELPETLNPEPGTKKSHCKNNTFPTMRKMFLRIGSIFALIGVALGALGAHALKGMLSPERLVSFETAVRYHLLHALAILAVALFIHFGKKRGLVTAGWLFTAGIVLFSGSIYLLALQDVLGLNLAFLGPITPIGGVAFMAGWLFVFISTFQKTVAYHGSGN